MINHAVKAIICDEEGRFLLQKRDSFPGLPFPGCWNFFGGLVDQGEDIKDALLRELTEELGVRITNPGEEQFQWEYRENWYTTFNHFFCIKDKFLKEELQLLEGAEMGWFFLHEMMLLDLTPAVYENYSKVAMFCEQDDEDCLIKIEHALIERNELIKKNNRVYYAKQNPAGLSRQAMGSFRELAILRKNPVLRICLHDTDESDVHEMLMIHAQHHSVGPLKQMKTSLSYHIIQGTLSICLHNENGEKTKEFIVSSDQSFENAISSIRLRASDFRSVKNLSESAIFLEVCSGPFKDSDTIWLS